MTRPTPAFHVTVAPSLAPLADRLVREMAAAPLPPREQEVVVVQSQGMREWLMLRIADGLGCAGSLLVPFPRGFATLAQRWAGISADARDPFTRDILVWRVESLLRRLPTNDARFAPLTGYLAHGDDRLRLGLAQRIAGRFDDYQLFRPDLLTAWEQDDRTADVVRELEASPHAAWQAALWRMITDSVARTTTLGDDTPAPDRTDLASANANVRIDRTELAVQRLCTAEPGTLALPPRIAVFGVSSLPPRFIALLAALARHTAVQVYVALPTPEPQHPLAAALGAQGNTLLALLGDAGATMEHLDAPAGAATATLLAQLQREIATGTIGTTPLDLHPTDRSLTLHVAHGMMREVEVIRDQLLDAFAADDTLAPHDVQVLVPDTATWRPVIEAVFGNAEEGIPRLPFRVVDRTAREAPAADAFLRLLALEGGRLAHSEVIGVLQHPLVCRAAGLDESAVEGLADVTHETNVRWGYDAESLERLDLPTADMPTWRMGIDRLLLGLMTGRADALVLGARPAAGDTAGLAESLGTLSAWIDRVASALSGLRTPRTLAEWTDALRDILGWSLLGATPEDRQSIQQLDQTLLALARQGSAGEHTDIVAFAVVRDWLDAALNGEGAGYGFVSGNITVAELKPMRSIPCRVIAVCGLDDGTFPRRDRRPAFDLMGTHPRPGDRNLREDDRQLFLDLLLAASDRLILSWSGRSARDNSVRAPSVVIDELLDYLDERMAGNASGLASLAARHALVVEHPLQPFSDRYLLASDDPRLFTFSQSVARAAIARRATERLDEAASEHGTDTPFIDSALPADVYDASRVIAISDLTALWKHPAKFFCQQRLQLTLTESGDDPDADSERFSMSAMEMGGERSAMLRAALAGDAPEPLEQERQRLVAAGTIPPGELGRAWLSKIREQVDPVRGILPEGAQRSIDVVVQGNGWRVGGVLHGVFGDTRHKARWKDYNAEQRIEAWVEHVVMCAARQQGADVPVVTALHGSEQKERTRNKVKEKYLVTRTDRLADVPDALSLVTSWVEIMAEALRTPLPFFPGPGAAWIDTARSGDGDPLTEAQKVFANSNSDFAPSGAAEHDAYSTLCFRGRPQPLVEQADEFERLARALRGPLPWADV